MAFLFFLFILLPLTGIFALIWLVTRNKIWGRIIGYFWFGLFCLFILGTVIRLLTDKKKLDRNDYTGQYIVSRSFFAGRQSDWQYDHFRFEIKANDSIFFYVTNKEKIIKTYRGTIKTTEANQHSSKRLIINMEQPTHHILTSDPNNIS
jgi:hypothetical protein